MKTAVNENRSRAAVINEQSRLRDYRGAFAAKCFAVHRKESTATSSFHCKDLLDPHEGIKTVEFSDDGTLLASGSCDNIVRLWPINNEAEFGRGHNFMAPIQMETRHASSVYTLAFTPDNRRLFSGGFDGRIFIHDVQT